MWTWLKNLFNSMRGEEWTEEQRETPTRTQGTQPVQNVQNFRVQAKSKSIYPKERQGRADIDPKVPERPRQFRFPVIPDQKREMNSAAEPLAREQKEGFGGQERTNERPKTGEKPGRTAEPLPHVERTAASDRSKQAERQAARERQRKADPTSPLERQRMSQQREAEQAAEQRTSQPGFGQTRQPEAKKPYKPSEIFSPIYGKVDPRPVKKTQEDQQRRQTREEAARMKEKPLQPIWQATEASQAKTAGGRYQPEGEAVIAGHAGLSGLSERSGQVEPGGSIVHEEKLEATETTALTEQQEPRESALGADQLEPKEPSVLAEQRISTESSALALAANAALPESSTSFVQPEMDGSEHSEPLATMKLDQTRILPPEPLHIQMDKPVAARPQVGAVAEISRTVEGTSAEAVAQQDAVLGEVETAAVHESTAAGEEKLAGSITIAEALSAFHTEEDTETVAEAADQAEAGVQAVLRDQGGFGEVYEESAASAAVELVETQPAAMDVAADQPAEQRGPWREAEEAVASAVHEAVSVDGRAVLESLRANVDLQAATIQLVQDEAAETGTDSSAQQSYSAAMQVESMFERANESENNQAEAGPPFTTADQAATASSEQEEASEEPVKLTYIPPQTDLLTPSPEATEDDVEYTQEQKRLLEETLSNFNVNANVVGIVKGPSVTRFELQPAPGVKVNKITGLSDDIKLNLSAKDIRIEAPIPGRNAVGIEVPNRKSEPVFISRIIDSEKFRNHPSPLAIALGMDIGGEPIVADIKKMPHGLIAGSTGSGKSVCINSIIVSLLFKASPEQVRLLLIDPKMVELAPYNHLPHLITPVVTEAKQATASLKWAVEEMERRYTAFVEAGVRDIDRYNTTTDEPLPYIVIIIDELADLMMVSPQDVEDCIIRIAQKARACGIHLLLATQRPSVDVITGNIKANVPTRLAFAVFSQIDSRTILDQSGAERLLGRGDMLFLESGTTPIRLQGNYVSDDEIELVTQMIKKQRKPNYYFSKEDLEQQVQSFDAGDDPLYHEALVFVAEQGQASASALQRRFRVGYNRAARLIEMMEAEGYVSGQSGGKPRAVLISREDAQALTEGTSLL